VNEGEEERRTVVDVAVTGRLLEDGPAADLLLDGGTAEVPRLERRHLDGGDLGLEVEAVEVVEGREVARRLVEVEGREGRAAGRGERERDSTTRRRTGARRDAHDGDSGQKLAQVQQVLDRHELVGCERW